MYIIWQFYGKISGVGDRNIELIRNYCLRNLANLTLNQFKQYSYV